MPVPICVHLSLHEVGTWLGESRTSFSVEILVKRASNAASDAPPVRPVWWDSLSALTEPAHYALGVSAELCLVIHQGVP